MVLGILGASLNAPPLKEITWASEMQKQYVLDLSFTVCPIKPIPAPSTKWTLASDLRALSTEGERFHSSL